MNDIFKFAQANDGTVQIARVNVPGCGRNERDDAPVILVEKDGDNITLFIYADILAKSPTHEISLNGAKLEKKAADHNG